MWLSALAMSEPDGGPSQSTVARVSWPVRTERLTLRAATTDDVEATWAYRRLDVVAEWLTSLPTDIDDYRKTFNEPGRLGDAVIAEHDGQLVGDFMLRAEDAWAQADVAEQAKDKQVELGWVLDPAYTGRGYATEAVRALIAVCFE